MKVERVVSVVGAGSEGEVIVISDSEEMEVEAPLEASLQLAQEVENRRPGEEIEGSVRRVRSESRSMRAEGVVGVETRDRSPSHPDEEREWRRQVGYCPVCGFRTRAVRYHVTHQHLPPAFGHKEWEDLDHLRFRRIMCIVYGLGLQSLDDVMVFLHRVKLAIPENSWLCDNDQA